MAENSKIEWTDHTFNPWRGCTKVSPGCANCYAETQAKRNPKTLGVWGKGQPRVLASEAMWKQPVRWNHTDAILQGGEMRRQRVFCASMADWLDDEVPVEWLARLLILILSTPNLDWLLLTKRPENWRKRLIAIFYSLPTTSEELDEPASLRLLLLGWLSDGRHIETFVPPNVWIGTTVEDQQRADERIPALLQIPAAVRFLSCEPLLGPVDLHSTHIKVESWRVGESFDGPRPLEGIHWLICGGESGPSARPMHPDWARSLRDQCAAAGVPFFFKQWGEWLPGIGFEDAGLSDFDEGQFPTTCALEPSGVVVPERHGRYDWQPAPRSHLMARVGKKAAGARLDGREHREFPKAEGRAASA